MYELETSEITLTAIMSHCLFLASDYLATEHSWNVKFLSGCVA